MYVIIKLFIADILDLWRTEKI